jgi:hypothetical protein
MAKDGAELSVNDKFELLLNALMAKQEQGISAETLKAILANNSTATMKALRPENQDVPKISVFNAKGDRDYPREKLLTHEFYYISQPIHKMVDTHMVRELELANQVVPGEYSVILKDGGLKTVTVTAERNAKQELTKVTVNFPVSREEKWSVPPMLVVLYQLVSKEPPRQRFIAAMNEFMQMTLGEELPASV